MLSMPTTSNSLVAGGANLTPEGVIEGPGWDSAGSYERNRAWSAWAHDAADNGEAPTPTIDTTLLPSAEDANINAELLQLMLDEPHIEAASLSSIKAPACVLVGEHDCITWDETCALRDAITGARLVVVPGAGHSLPRVAPDAVALQVLTNVLRAAR
jgi:pimeloyl-ACP methyl ester carboxylesterase